MIDGGRNLSVLEPMASSHPMVVKERDPFVLCAKLRCVVRLDDGTTGRLIYWGRTGMYAKLYISGRFEQILKDRIVDFITEAAA